MLKIQKTDQKLQAQSLNYLWEYEIETDTFNLYDSKNRLISRAKHQPLLITSPTQTDFFNTTKSFDIKENSISISYHGLKTASHLTVTWHFTSSFISLQPLEYESTEQQDIVKIIYFPKPTVDSYSPSLYSHYVVIPGLAMTTNINPIVDLHSNLSITAILGSGAMRGPGFAQQWGLPAHYFCTFNTSDRWNAIGAKKLQSDAACWGLSELPQGDFQIQIREIGISPILNIRSDLWKHVQTKQKLNIGFSFLITFGENYHQAIRNYYKTVQTQKVIKQKAFSQKKKEVMLSAQYNTWGVECAKALPPEHLTENIVKDIFDKLQASGMKAKTFVIDDKWEGEYGELKHDETRFPHFEKLLSEIRQQGYFIGLWAAFLRCQNPQALGLSESHLLQTAEKKPLWLAHQTAKYGIFDVTQLEVQEVLKKRAKEFIRRYQPDLIKFDFGYELPSLDIAAPKDLDWSGERLLQKGLEIIVNAMKEENPDLVIMYYGLSPLLIDYYDLHSPDDLVYCLGDYDLETNRRIFLSSLCGELGMPTYGSSGYDWESAIDIWFDSAPSGSLGSLHCFDGDENGQTAEAKHIAIFNGINSIVRKEAVFETYPIHAKWQGGLRAGFAPSWERIENGKTVLLALRTHQFDGKPLPNFYKNTLFTDVMIVVASLTNDDLSESHHLGVVPFANGKCILQNNSDPQTVSMIEHFLSGEKIIKKLNFNNQQVEIEFNTTKEDTLEWLEIIFE